MAASIATYKAQFERLHRAKIKGLLAPHKIILLLAILDQVEECLVHGEAGRDVVRQHPMAFRPHLEYFFYKEWNLHVKSDVFRPSYENPLIHMQYEPFYRLVSKLDDTGRPIPYSGAHSLTALEKAFVGIRLDAELIELLIDENNRKEMRRYLIDLL